MSTEKQLAANRQNASRSSGPHSSSGKPRAAQNARRHGIRRYGMADPVFNARVKHLAEAIAGEGADEKTRRVAQELAAAEIEIGRIRQANVASIEMMLSFATLSRSSEPGGVRLETVADSDQDAEAIRRAIPELRIFDRYEQSVRSRRNRALA